MYKPEKLLNRRKELGLTQKDVAAKMGITHQAYSTWERGLKRPSATNINKLEAVLQVGEGYFTEHDIMQLYNGLSINGRKKLIDYANQLTVAEKQPGTSYLSEKCYEYHVYEKMSAGVGASVYGDLDFDTVYYDKEIVHDFASWVYGDSMEPKYPNGSVALIKENGFDYAGAVYAVVWNGQTYIKQVYRETDGLRLVSINKKYKDLFAPFDDEPRVIGMVVGHFIPIVR